MFRNYFLIAIRNLFKNKVHSFITITGLSLGMAGAALLLLNIRYEFTVDQFHQKKDHIYKIFCQGTVDGNTIHFDYLAPPLAPALQKEYPEIKSMTRLANTGKFFGYADKRLQSGGLQVDPAFLTMFSFPLLQGHAQSALNRPQTIVVTEKLAKKLFGDADPMNKVIRADNAANYIVTGVMKDLPANTKFTFDYLLPWTDTSNHWDNFYAGAFVELHDGVNVAALNKKMQGIISSHDNNSMNAKPFLHPLPMVNLYSRFENGKVSGGKISELKMLGGLAAIILLIGCINFMNLSTARSEKRAREVGVRKVMGALKSRLIAQFLIEATLLAAVAGVIALLLVQLVWPTFSVLTKVRMASIPWQLPAFWLASIGFILFTGLLAGSYPAFYLSAFKPVSVLKGVLQNGKALVTPRKILVVTQFVIAVFLINYTIIIRKQMHHAQGRELGFVKENLLFHNMTDDLHKNYDVLKNELITSGIASSVCATSGHVSRGGIGLSGLTWDGSDKAAANISFELVNTTGDFVKTNGLTLLAGRDINLATFPADTAACLLNEAAVKATGLKDPIGKIITDVDFKYKVVGVIKDYLIGDPVDGAKPVFVRGEKHVSTISIRLAGNHPSSQTIAQVHAMIKKYNTNFITDIEFADDDYANKFKQARNAATLMNSFTLVAIVIACLGLFGLTTYMTENRVREIGIRKVLGASVAGVTALLAKDFIKLVVISIFIASPLAWWAMHSWLQQFAYRTSLSWWVIAGAGVVALLIAFVTVSIQSIRAAMANPSKSLRAE